MPSKIGAPPSVPIGDFLAEGVAPRGQRSVLEPFAKEIYEARDKHGLSLDQVVEWLARNGVVSTRQNLHKWMERREARAVRKAQKSTQGATARPRPVNSSRPPGDEEAEAPESHQVVAATSKGRSGAKANTPGSFKPSKQVDVDEFKVDEASAYRGQNPLTQKK